MAESNTTPPTDLESRVADAIANGEIPMSRTLAMVVTRIAIQVFEAHMREHGVADHAIEELINAGQQEAT